MPQLSLKSILGEAIIVTGQAEVLATAGQELGGETVDGWLCQEVARQTGMDTEWVRQDLAWEVELAKKRLSGHEMETVDLHRARFTREEFVALLEQQGLYRDLSEGVAVVLQAAARHAEAPDENQPAEGSLEIGEALLIGGSTLLPGVPECIEEVLGLRPRHWRPFEAVARGAALFGAGRSIDPVFYHDYAVRLRKAGTNPPDFEYERLVPAGSPYPTPPGREVVRHYRVRPGLNRFSLPICEIGRFGWPELPWEKRSNEGEYWQPARDRERARIRCLNETAPDLPIHPPSRDDRTRLRVTYRVDEERHLRVDVFDLLTRQPLRQGVRVATLAEGGREDGEEA